MENHFLILNTLILFVPTVSLLMYFIWLFKNPKKNDKKNLFLLTSSSKALGLGPSIMLFPSTFSLILNFPWLGGAVVFASPNAYRGCPNFSFEILDRKPSWCSRVVKLRRRYESSSPADLRNPWKPLGYTLPGTLFLVIFFLNFFFHVYRWYCFYIH